MGKLEETEKFCPKNRKEWSSWLEKNHETGDAIWIIFHKKSSPNHNLTYQEALDDALCFGWIDSVVKNIDEHSRMQYFSKRRKGSVWSAKNKRSVDELIKNNSMQDAGLKVIERAKQDGTYYILDEIEKMAIPKELEEAFKKNPNARKFFEESSKLDKKRILYPLATLKQEASRKRNVEKIIEFLTTKK